MQMIGHTILITGGASGIGASFARRFLERGNTVIVCGRRQDKLAELREQRPEVRTLVCDVSNASARENLAAHIVDDYPELNVLINNAGIQRRVDLAAGEEWSLTQSEIAINLEAPIHLTRLLLPHLLSKESATIANVTSGLSFVPLANVPVYCATKAALHSFTQSLRRQLRDTSVEAIEIIPPAVDTDLQAPGLHTFGVNVDEFADHVFAELEKGETEIAYGTADLASKASPDQLLGIYERMNNAFH
jgi:uncharacterized oxidoreductase